LILRLRRGSLDTYDCAGQAGGRVAGRADYARTAQRQITGGGSAERSASGRDRELAGDLSRLCRFPAKNNFFLCCSATRWWSPPRWTTVTMTTTTSTSSSTTTPSSSSPAAQLAEVYFQSNSAPYCVDYSKYYNYYMTNIMTSNSTTTTSTTTTTITITTSRAAVYVLFIPNPGIYKR
jgi:hypothetical protein